MQPQQDLNKDLLQAAEVNENAVAEEVEPKRNSKDDLVAKIINCCADNNLELEYSNTKLRRMTKTELCRVLAAKIELGIRSQMAAQVGAKPGAADSVIALGALKMIHNLAAGTAEKGLNMFLPAYGYEIHGFTSALKDPNVDEAVTQCLQEIAAESDILQYIESPYVRLAIAWGGALVTSLRKKRIIQRERYYASPMGPRKTPAEDTLQLSVGRREKAGKELCSERPSPPDERSV